MKRSAATTIRVAVAAASTLAATISAGAHGLAAGAVDPHWTFDPWVVAPLVSAAVLYALGAVRIGRTTRKWQARRSAQAALYAAGWIALAAALVSPLHWLGEHLFAFHMIEHELVMAIAAPLLVLARPAGTVLWAMPKTLRQAIGSAFLQRRVHALWRWATRPLNATLLHGTAIWIWHVPALFDAAVADVSLHRLQHLSFLLTALCFWWAMLRRARAGVAVWHLFVTMVHTSILGAWIALAPRVMFHLQTIDAPAFGLTPLEDQQLAGVLMWVPAETVYAGAALWMAARWIRRSRRRAEPAATAEAPLAGFAP